MNNKGSALLIGLLVILAIGGGILAVTSLSKSLPSIDDAKEEIKKNRN